MHKSSANRGKYWEGVLENSWPLVPKCTVVKMDAPFQVTKEKSPGKFEGYWKAKGVCDFEGGCCGIAVALDAKQVTDSARFPFSKIPEHQLDRMKRTHLMGGMSGVLVCWKSGGMTTAAGLSYLYLVELMGGKEKSVHYQTVMDKAAHDESKAMILRWTMRNGKEAVHLARFMDNLQGG